MENHASRPEIAQAMKEGRGSASRYSTTYAKRSYYAAVRLDNGQILRVGDTIDSVYGTLFPGVFMLLLPLVLLLILSFYLIDRTTKRMREPLRQSTWIIRWKMSPMMNWCLFCVVSQTRTKP